MSTLKAYQVRESSEGHCVIRFATSSAAARREGAAELDTCWEGIESCNRTPEFDQYAPGPVPPLVLIEHGWWIECTYCGRRVSEDEYDEEEDEPPPGPPAAIGRNVFCCEEHAARQIAKWRGNAAAKAALCELIYTRWPAAEIVRAHVYGDRLVPPERRNGLLIGGIPCVADFRLPGLTYPVTYHFGEAVYVSTVDEETFRAMYGLPRQLAEA